MQAVMSAEEMTDWLESVFPQVKSDFVVESIDGVNTVMRMKVAERHLRPGGTVSGPSMFALADVSAYVATMARIGKEALTVTTGCSLDFMRKPEAGKDLIAHATLLKLGRTLSVTSILLYSEGNDAPVARANMTYAIPPRT
ncbi:Thioesterase superfamily protein [Shimia sp. SK013]|uniref:PaaI family thioesterase n=1 Tax=Shimia sp. SK013 TaxID=1389006 RepID=UPI0006B658CD|nr:PaaI family thioesterase [Shimia sp. SK013]KPA22704.1 Thioesterase superfamily protein [Shimia sp. SK013]